MGPQVPIFLLLTQRVAIRDLYSGRLRRSASP